MTTMSEPRRARPAEQKRMALLSRALPVLLLAATTAACGSSGSGGTSGPNGVVTVTTGAANAFTADFNPFSPNDNDPTNGMIYENLYYFDTVDNKQVDPWLATSYSWNSTGTSVTFQLRHGVKWSDGTAFTSADVVFTFQKMISEPTPYNNYSLPITGATADGQYAATLTFSKPVYSDLYYIAGKVDILPQHIWKSVTDPSTFLNSKPVGTGAFEVSSVTPQVMTFTANPNYYQPGYPKIKTVRFLSYNGNTASNAAIESGQLDWGGNYIPNIQQNYLSKNPKFQLVNIPLSIAFFVPSLTSGPTAQLPVREAISEALNRTFISQTVYDGQAPATNPEALLTPNFSSVVAPSMQAQLPGAANDSQAESTLEAAGYKMGSDGIFNDPSGNALNVTVQVISGYTDYVQIVQIAQQELKSAGINLEVQSESYQQFTNNQDNGDFQLLIDNFGYTPSAYSYYYNLLDSAVAPKAGTADTVGNFGSYKNTKVDDDLATIAGTNDTSAQNTAFADIEQQFVKDEPLIPLFEQQNEQEFNGAKITGYPTKSNPYASAAIYMQPDIGWVMMRIAPTS
ncbi:MAG TPA: ABC transporter substrate-binding protein [Actinocrinis sp.]|jgi:peptide/nickel transport system substrate-binding protein